MSRKKSEALTIAAELMADMGCCIHDAAILTLCLLACMAAECIPLLLPLVATAGVLTVCRMAYYRKCPWCGAALDPQEICDCQERREMQLPGQKKNRSGCDHTQSGKAKRKSNELNGFALSLSENKGECQE